MILILDILHILINVAWWIIIIQFVLSILITFNVINLYNDYVRAIWDALNKITEPVYRPIRRILPDFGALDFSPMVVIVILMVLEGAVLPALARLVSGGSL